jgi:hypothetical protein
VVLELPEFDVTSSYLCFDECNPDMTVVTETISNGVINDFKLSIFYLTLFKNIVIN